MVALIVKGTVCDNDIGRLLVSFGRFFASGLLWAKHYERELTCWLPYFIFLHDFFRICGHIVLGTLIIPWFGAFSCVSIIDFVPIIVSSWMVWREMLFFFLVDDSASCENIEAGLCFCD